VPLILSIIGLVGGFTGMTFPVVGGIDYFLFGFSATCVVVNAIMCAKAIWGRT